MAQDFRLEHHQTKPSPKASERGGVKVLRPSPSPQGPPSADSHQWVSSIWLPSQTQRQRQGQGPWVPPLRPHPCSASLLSSLLPTLLSKPVGDDGTYETQGDGLDQNMRLRMQGAPHHPNIQHSDASHPLFLSLGLCPCLAGIQTQGGKDVGEAQRP